jgi:hypothetical protein
MRADMAKVIVERPRKKGCAWNKPKGYQRRLRRYGDDGPPVREGIKACWRGRLKYLNEHLGPLAKLSSQASSWAVSWVARISCSVARGTRPNRQLTDQRLLAGVDLPGPTPFLTPLGQQEVCHGLHEGLDLPSARVRADGGTTSCSGRAHS